VPTRKLKKNLTQSRKDAKVKRRLNSREKAQKAQKKLNRKTTVVRYSWTQFQSDPYRRSEGPFSKFQVLLFVRFVPFCGYFWFFSFLCGFA